MKILLAITSTNHDIVGDNALRWCGRLGFDIRLFIPKGKRFKYEDVLLDTNYHWYLDLPPIMLVTRTDAENYAKQHEYDLLLTVPEDLPSWRKDLFLHPEEIAYCHKSIGNARLEFAQKPKKRIKRWANGCIMKRVEK